MALGLVAALGAAAVFGYAAILQARSVRRVTAAEVKTGAAGQIGRTAATSTSDATHFIGHLLRQPLYLVAVLLNLCGFALHLVAIRTIPLYLAQAAVACSLAVTAVLAVLLMNELLTRGDWAAVAAITLGLVLLASASGHIGKDTPPAGFLLLLGLTIAAIAVLGLVLAHSGTAYAPSLLGFLAGLGFACSGLSARVLPTLTSGALWTSPATYLLPLSGALAFALYSVALRRGVVTEATGPMIVMQTVTPALVGVAVLGDHIRSGWAPVAVAGFVLTGIGAVALARFESGLDGHAAG